MANGQGQENDLRYCSCGIVAGKTKTTENFVAGRNRKCYKTYKRHCVFCHGTNDCHQETTCFAIYDCKPTTRQKPSFAAVELWEGCGNKGFDGLPCFKNSKFGWWLRRCISQDREGCYGLPMVLKVSPNSYIVTAPLATCHTATYEPHSHRVRPKFGQKYGNELSVFLDVLGSLIYFRFVFFWGGQLFQNGQ